MSSSFKRLFRHLAHDARSLRRAFPSEVLDRIEQCVIEGERQHGAQLRIAIEACLPPRHAWSGHSPRDRALQVFSDLRVWDTEANNGVLLYVLLADHAVEILADRAAAQAIPAGKWESVARDLGAAYREGHYLEGTVAAVERLDNLLGEVFPPDEHNLDELPNRPVLL